MTPNDAQIDLLLKRHAQRARPRTAAEHLDADQLNAFAEGALPASTRAQFVSHLADCDDCRKIATQLVSIAGVIAPATIARDEAREAASWRKKLTAYLLPARLRYAAFAVVLLAAATVTYVALRNEGTRFSETRVQAPQTQVAEVKSQETPPVDQVQMDSNTIAKSGAPTAQPAQPPGATLKPGESTIVQNGPPAAPKAATEETKAPEVTANRETEQRAAETVPSFAPPPPGETERPQQARSREPQTIGGVGGRKDEAANPNFGALDRGRSNEVQMNRNSAAAGTASTANQPPRPSQASDDKSLAKTKETDAISVSGRDTSEFRIEAAPKEAAKRAAPMRARAEEAPETRAAGGRKFRRQGSAWVDTKFKSSMTVKSISRGSDEYRELASGLRSIAEQLGGDVLIVWKGKAYRIH